MNLTENMGEYKRQWQEKNKDHIRQYSLKYKLEHSDFLERHKIAQKKYYFTHREYYKTYGKEYYKTYGKNTIKKYKSKFPWKRFKYHAKARCTNPKHCKFLRYGARGIKYFLSDFDLKILWFRDKAFQMKSPTIDRINNDGNYELSNCQFLERIDNIKKWFKNK